MAHQYQRKPRVLLISHSCRTAVEGHPRAAALHALGTVDLKVITPRTWRFYGKWTGVEHPHPSLFNMTDHAVILPWLPGIGSHMHTYVGLRHILNGYQPDIVDIWEEPWAMVSAHATKLIRSEFPNTKILLETEQNLYKTLPPPFSNFWEYTCREADYLVGRSEEAVDVSKAYGYRGEAAVLPNGVDTTQFHPRNRAISRVRFGIPDERFIVGYAGRFVEEKGLMDLLNAVGVSDPKVHCWLVGGGPQKDDLAARAKQSDLEGRVHFLPNQSHTALAEIMSAFDVFALPSRTVGNWKEQFGRVIAEAGAAGISVIGSDSGAIPDVIGDAGIVFPEGDEKAIAAAIKTLHEQPALRTQYGANGRRRAEELYSWQPVAQQYSDLLLYLTGLKERPDFTQDIT